jgi:hypothetical protein
LFYGIIFLQKKLVNYNYSYWVFNEKKKHFF